MEKTMIIVVLVYWATMSACVMHWHYKRGDLEIGTVILALILGPILAIIIRDNERKIKKQRGETENDRHRRWFRTMGEINRQRIPDFGRTIPPPPPISQRTRINQEELRSEWRRQKGISKLKDFKFFHK